MSTNRDEPLSFLTPSATSSPTRFSDGDSYLLDPSSASGSFQNEGFLSGGGDDAESGFLRQDFRQGPLVGTVEFYDRHVFLCYKNPRVWPPRIEAAEFDRLPRILSAALAARKGDMKKQTRLTICEGHDGTETSNGDVLIFPDMIRYRRLTHFDVDTFVEEVLVKNGEWLPGTPEALRGFYIFVCAHGSRDRRCGVCGPPLVARFKEEIEFHGLQNKISVSPCSHIGGDKYAGNVIIYGSSIGGEVTGHWYGYVSPDDVPVLLEQHIGRGEIVDWLWRGQMGLTEEDQKKSQDFRLQLNSKSDIKITTPEPTQTKYCTISTCASLSEGTVCCQFNGGSPCLNPPIMEDLEDIPQLLEREAKSSAEKKSIKRQISRKNSGGKGSNMRKIWSSPTWFESVEREDVYAGLAVVVAAISVGYAYSCYKQLR